MNNAVLLFSVASVAYGLFWFGHSAYFGDVESMTVAAVLCLMAGANVKEYSR